jgi:hypothetical protein
MHDVAHIIGGIVAIVLLALTLYLVLVFLLDEIARRRQRRLARIEAELDAKSEQLRRTILSLAEQLAADRDQTAREMTRQAFLQGRETMPDD